jgi:uncharacterized membrane protein YfcA
LEILLISIVAFLASILTFFSGFGLGTLLTPVFVFFFPIEIAIGLTGIVHLCNNLFKLILVGKKFNKAVVIRFGIPAIFAALLGSSLLILLSEFDPLFSYTLLGKTFYVYPVKFIISILLIIFSTMDFIPYFKKLEFNQNKLPIGGLLSGFFGGLSGNQGALRSAFLIRTGLSKESFIATTVVISTFIDITRLSIYSSNYSKINLTENWSIVLIATLSAITGAFIGNKLLKKVTFKFLQTIIAVMLIIISIALGMGLI